LNERHNGAFTKSVIEGLRGPGSVTWADVISIRTDGNQERMAAKMEKDYRMRIGRDGPFPEDCSWLTPFLRIDCAHRIAMGNGLQPRWHSTL
jgi:hypothetical protein